MPKPKLIESPIIKACWCSKTGKWGPPHDQSECGAAHHKETLVGMNTCYNLLNAAHAEWKASQDYGSDGEYILDAYSNVCDPEDFPGQDE